MLKCQKCQKKVNKENLKGVPWNDWPLSKPKIKWFCSECFRAYKTSQKFKKDLEAKLYILEVLIEHLGGETPLDIEVLINAYPEHQNFIEKHKKMSFWELRAIEGVFEKRRGSGTNVYEQTRLIKPGDPFF